MTADYKRKLLSAKNKQKSKIRWEGQHRLKQVPHLPSQGPNGAVGQNPNSPGLGAHHRVLGIRDKGRPSDVFTDHKRGVLVLNIEMVHFRNRFCSTKERLSILQTTPSEKKTKIR